MVSKLISFSAWRFGTHLLKLAGGRKLIELATRCLAIEPREVAYNSRPSRLWAARPTLISVEFLRAFGSRQGSLPRTRSCPCPPESFRKNHAPAVAGSSRHALALRLERSQALGEILRRRNLSRSKRDAPASPVRSWRDQRTARACPSPARPRTPTVPGYARRRCPNVEQPSDRIRQREHHGVGIVFLSRTACSSVILASAALPAYLSG